MGTARSIEERLDALEYSVNLAVNYMREIATIIGARERLSAIDRELQDQERRDTDPAPPQNGDTQP